MITMLDIRALFLEQLQARPHLVNTVISVAVLTLLGISGKKLLLWYRLSRLPLVNGAGLFSSDETKKNFRQNSRAILREGFTKSSRAFRVATDDTPAVVLSPEYVNEIRNDPRFSFTDLIAEECLCHIPPFRNFNPHEGLNDMAKDVLQKRLTPSLGLVTHDISEEATSAFQDYWSDSTEWHALDAKETIVQIIARLSSRVFLGPELCRNPDWLHITIDYTMTVFRGVMALKQWPSFLQPLVWRYVPEVRRVNEQIDEAVRLITPVIDKKKAEASSVVAGEKATHLDVIQWATEVSKGRYYDPTLLQLGFSMASMHNTTDLVTQVLYDLCAHPEYVEPLRKEAETILKEEGMSKAGLARLKLMDSFMKECQRIKPSELLGMRRVLLENVTLSGGVFLPKGIQIGIPTTSADEAEISPASFNGYRFYQMENDPAKEKTRHFVSTSPDYLGFGHGKHACPGRFFASHEVKIILCHVLLKYDIKLNDGGVAPVPFAMGWALLAQPGYQIMVRKREGVNEGLLG